MNDTVAPGIPTTSHSNTINNTRNEEQRNRLIFAWIVPFLDIHDLSNLCLTSRDLCALIRADLFRHVVLRDITAAAAFCRTILEDPVVVANLDEVPLSERDVLDGGCGFGGFGRSVARTIKVLGWHVRSMKLSFPLDVIKTLESFEEQFLKIIPFLPRLRKLSWLLHAVPLSDRIWTSLLRHCPKLSTIDLANANGILPESHFYNLKDLDEFRIRYWNSNVSPATLYFPTIHPLPDTSKHPLLHTLTTLNPNLTALELNASPWIGPSLEVLFRLGLRTWPNLKELALVPVPLFRGAECGFGYGGRRASLNADDPMGLLRRSQRDGVVRSEFADALVAFLESHPGLESVRLGTGSRSFVHAQSVFDAVYESTARVDQQGEVTVEQTNGDVIDPADMNPLHAPVPMNGQTQHLQRSSVAEFPPALLSGLPSSALPRLRTFEGPTLHDFLVILDPRANRPLDRLTEAKGWLTVGRPDGFGVSSSRPGTPGMGLVQVSNGLEDASSLVNPSPGVPVIDTHTNHNNAPYFNPPSAIPLPTFAHALANNPSIRVVILRLGATPLGRDDLSLLLSSLPNVQHLVLMARCVCRHRYVIQAFSQLKSLKTLSVDESFAAEKDPKYFTSQLARACTQLGVVSIMRPNNPNRYMYRRDAIQNEPFNIIVAQDPDHHHHQQQQQNGDDTEVQQQGTNSTTTTIDERVDAELFFGCWDDGYDAKHYAISWGRTKADREMRFKQTHGMRRSSTGLSMNTVMSSPGQAVASR